jgi:hypothetical protein
MNSVPELNLENFNVYGQLTTDVNKEIENRKVDINNFSGLSFVLFYSKPCCKEYIKALEEIHSKIKPFKVYLYQTSKGTNSSIFSLKDAPYRIMGFPYVITYYDGYFCSVYKPNNLPEPNKLFEEFVKFSNKITNLNSCKN